uniref:Uncharacterized protein n=1 Tax=Glossina pallidipes TaxID=7398 RepID=A0A1A9ZB72_GLOPL
MQETKANGKRNISSSSHNVTNKKKHQFVSQQSKARDYKLRGTNFPMCIDANNLFIFVGGFVQPIYSIIGNQFINMMASIKHGLYELECDVKRVCRGNAANVMVKNSKHKITAANGIQQMLLYSVQSIKSRFWF